MGFSFQRSVMSSRATSESPGFEGAVWSAYAAAPVFTLTAERGAKTVYLKVRNAAGESEVAQDSITLR